MSTGNESYITAISESGLPYSRKISGGTGIAINDSGPRGKLEVRLKGKVNSIENLAPLTRGFLVKSNNEQFSTINFESPSNTIDITFPSGITGTQVYFDVANNTSIQKINVALNGSIVAANQTINFVSTPSAGVIIQNDPSNSRTNVGFVATGGGGEPGTLTREVISFDDSEWSVSGDTASLTILEASHGLEEGILVQVMDGDGYIITDTIQTQIDGSNNIVFSVAAGEQFTGSVVLVGNAAA